MMNRFATPFFVAVAVAVAVALVGCDVKDLELDTDATASTGSDSTSGSDASGLDPSASVGDPTVEETDPFSDPFSDPLDWGLRMATARCEAFFRCDCAPNVYTDVEACAEDFAGFYGSRALWAQTAGATLDLECLGEHVGVLFNGPCEDTVPPMSEFDLEAAFGCRMFEGDRGLGEACTPVDQWLSPDESCAENLMCLEGTCLEAPGEGEPCATSDGGWSACAPGLRCTQDGCRAPGDLGDACVEFSCGHDSMCEDGVCVALRDTGAACESGRQCASRGCASDQCAPPAALLCGPYAYEVSE